MSGYAGYSMSNNGVAAYADYKMPASRAKSYLGLKDLGGISASEWHHTSKKYNSTDFYDLRDLIIVDILTASSRPRPNPLQLWHRVEVAQLKLDEGDYDAEEEEFLQKLVATANIYDAPADAYLKNRREKKEAKLAKKREAEKLTRTIELEETRKVATKTESATLKRRCECMGISVDTIQVAMAGPIPPDPTCLTSQIRKWFVHYSIEEAVKFGLEVQNGCQSKKINVA